MRAWLLLGVIGVAGRLGTDSPDELVEVFAAELESAEMAVSA